jgi:hypothetical protein
MATSTGLSSDIARSCPIRDGMTDVALMIPFFIYACIPAMGIALYVAT